MAIAYDNSNSVSGAGSSFTMTETVGIGSDRIAIIQLLFGNVTITSISFAGQTPTLITNLAYSGGSEHHAFYYVIAPTSGSQTLEVNFSGTTGYEACVATYSGAHQTSPIGATITTTTVESGTNSDSESLTTLTNNSWVLWGLREYAGRTITAGTNTALRRRVAVQWGLVYADSNAAVTPAGSRTLNLNANLAANWIADILVELKASTTTLTNTTNFFQFF